MAKVSRDKPVARPTIFSYMYIYIGLIWAVGSRLSPSPRQSAFMQFCRHDMIVDAINLRSFRSWAYIKLICKLCVGAYSCECNKKLSKVTTWNTQHRWLFKLALAKVCQGQDLRLSDGRMDGHLLAITIATLDSAPLCGSSAFICI